MICWDILRYTKIYWDILIYNDIYNDILWFTVIYWDILRYTKIFRNILRYTMIYWDIQWYTIFYYNILGYKKIYWDILRYTEIYWTDDELMNWWTYLVSWRLECLYIGEWVILQWQFSDTWLTMDWLSGFSFVSMYLEWSSIGWVVVNCLTLDWQYDGWVVIRWYPCNLSGRLLA